MRQLLTDEQMEAKSRPIVIALCMLTLRLMENWHLSNRVVAAEESIDIDSTMIVLAVVAIGAEKFTRAGLESGLHDLTVAMPQRRLSPCNISSIASATSLKRETVRRKVSKLIAAGILEKEHGGGIRATPAYAASPEVRSRIRAQVDLLEKTFHQLRSLGQERSTEKKP